MANSNLEANTNTNPKRVCIIKNNSDQYLIISDVPGARVRTTATGLGDAMAAAYRLIG